MTDWSYDVWPSGEPYSWGGAARGVSPYDLRDFHVDLGCGRVKKGRIGVDRYPAPGVNVIADLNTGQVFGCAPEPGDDAVDGHGRQAQLPFSDSSIESIISHHCFEHIGDGFIGLMEDCYRVLKPGGLLRIIVPLFPSWSAVSDPDHRRYFMADVDGNCTLDAFCGTPGDTPSNCWLASFSVPYTTARFRKLDQDFTGAPQEEYRWTSHDARELRVALEAVK